MSGKTRGGSAGVLKGAQNPFSSQQGKPNTSAQQDVASMLLSNVIQSGIPERGAAGAPAPVGGDKGQAMRRLAVQFAIQSNEYHSLGQAIMMGCPSAVLELGYPRVYVSNIFGDPPAGGWPDQAVRQPYQGTLGPLLYQFKAEHGDGHEAAMALGQAIKSATESHDLFDIGKALAPPNGFAEAHDPGRTPANLGRMYRGNVQGRGHRNRELL